MTTITKNPNKHNQSLGWDLNTEPYTLDVPNSRLRYVWPRVWSLAIFNVSQLPDPVNEPWLSCMSVTLPVRQYLHECGETIRDTWATKEKNKPKLTGKKNASVNKLMTMTHKGASVVRTIMYSKDFLTSAWSTRKIHHTSMFVLFLPLLRLELTEEARSVTYNVLILRSVCRPPQTVQCLTSSSARTLHIATNI
jgi:hypothetical protein